MVVLACAVVVAPPVLAHRAHTPADRQAPAAPSAQPPGRPAPQDEYVPIDQLPPQEEVPAAPMVVAAYSFVWVAFLAYVFTLVRRIRKVEADLAALERERR